MSANIHWHKTGIGQGTLPDTLIIDGQKDVQTGNEEMGLEPHGYQQEDGEMTKGKWGHHMAQKHKRERNCHYLWRATFSIGWTTPM